MGDVVNSYNFLSYANQILPSPIWFHGFVRDSSFYDYIQFAFFYLIDNGDGSYRGECKQVNCLEVNASSIPEYERCLYRPLSDISCADLYELGIAKAYIEKYNVRDCSICTKRNQCKDRGMTDISLGCFLFEVDINHVRSIIDSRDTRWIDLR